MSLENNSQLERKKVSYFRCTQVTLEVSLLVFLAILSKTFVTSLEIYSHSVKYFIYAAISYLLTFISWTTLLNIPHRLRNACAMIAEFLACRAFAWATVPFVILFDITSPRFDIRDTSAICIHYIAVPLAIFSLCTSLWHFFYFLRNLFCGWSKKDVRDPNAFNEPQGLRLDEEASMGTPRYHD